MPRAITQSHLLDRHAEEQDMSLLLLSLVTNNSWPVNVGWTESRTIEILPTRYSAILFMITHRNVCICAGDEKGRIPCARFFGTTRLAGMSWTRGSRPGTQTPQNNIPSSFSLNPIQEHSSLCRLHVFALKAPFSRQQVQLQKVKKKLPSDSTFLSIYSCGGWKWTFNLHNCTPPPPLLQ